MWDGSLWLSHSPQALLVKTQEKGQNQVTDGGLQPQTPQSTAPSSKQQVIDQYQTVGFFHR